LGNGSGNNYLSGTIHVGCGKSDFVGSGNYFVWLSSEDGAHAGWGEGSGLGHGKTTLADEHHGLLGGQNPGTDGRRYFTDGVSRGNTNSCVSG
jgi:hypothetical protein